VSLTVWNDNRALTPRIVVSQQDMAARGMRLRFVTEQVDQPTDWCCFDDSRHLIYVHRQGSLQKMETGLQWEPSSNAVPRVGDIWVVPAGERCASLVHGGEPAGFCEIAIPVQTVGEDALVPRVKKRDPLIYQLSEGLAKLFGREDAPARLLKDSLAESLRLHISDTCAVTRPRRTSGRTALDASTRTFLVEFLEDGLDSEITVETMAAFAEMSVSRFIKAFAAAFHTTPHQYLLGLRIERAKSLLVTTSRSITEISSAVGFSKPNHFATAFRHRVGVSPTDYRRNG
jgi:AraC family transcriptional regulator